MQKLIPPASGAKNDLGEGQIGELHREAIMNLEQETIITTGAQRHGKGLDLLPPIPPKRPYVLGLRACLMGLVFLAGCHPAALVIPSYIQTVGVQLFDNRTSYYGLDTLFTAATIRQFQIDGRLPIADPG